MAIHAIEDVLGDLSSFLETTILYVENLGLPIIDNEIDHVCFRCDSTKQYQNVCSVIVNKGLGVIQIESIIGNRPISIIRLSNPIKFKHWDIWCLEITCPKPGRTHKNGYEHIEVVIDKENQCGFHNSKAFLSHFAERYPSINFDTKAIDKEVNADLSITTDTGTSVKFHARPIYEVCAYEIDHGHFTAVPVDYFN